MVTVKMSYKMPGMHAGVCSSGTGGFGFRTGKHLQRLFNLFLHRTGIRLQLPAMISSSLKRQVDEVTHFFEVQKFRSSELKCSEFRSSGFKDNSSSNNIKL